MNKITLLTIVFIALVTFKMRAQETEIVLSQSVNQQLTLGGVACNGGDNSWYREYVLSDEGVTNDVTIVGIQFGLELTTFNEELKIYAYDFPGFPLNFDTANVPTPIASGSITVRFTDVGKIIRADFDTPVQVSAGSSIVVSVVQPTITSNPVYLATTEQETKTSFLSSNNCDIKGQPAPVSAIGFPDAHHMINLIVTDETLSLNNKLMESVTVYPNPTQGNLNLRIPSHIEVLNVKLFDVLGKNVNVPYHNQTLTTETLPQGIYMLHVETSQGALIKKIVKQ